MPVIKLYYDVELTLYKEEILDAIQHPVDIFAFDEEFQFNFIDFMNKNKSVWLKNLLDMNSISSIKCIREFYFTLSKNMLCFTIKTNSKDVLNSAISDVNIFYDSWASYPACGENKLEVSSDTFYDIFLIPVDKIIEDELDNLIDLQYLNKLNQLIQDWNNF